MTQSRQVDTYPKWIASVDEAKSALGSGYVRIKQGLSPVVIAEIVKNLRIPARLHLLPSDDEAIYEDIILSNLPSGIALKIKQEKADEEKFSYWAGRVATKVPVGNSLEIDKDVNGLVLPDHAEPSALIRAATMLSKPHQFLKLPSTLIDEAVITNLLKAPRYPYTISFSRYADFNQYSLVIKNMPALCDCIYFSNFIIDRVPELMQMLPKNKYVYICDANKAVGYKAIESVPAANIFLHEKISAIEAGKYIAALKDEHSKIELDINEIVLPPLPAWRMKAVIQALQSHSNIVLPADVSMSTAITIASFLKPLHNLKFSEGLPQAIRLAVTKMLYKNMIMMGPDTTIAEARELAAALSIDSGIYLSNIYSAELCYAVAEALPEGRALFCNLSVAPLITKIISLVNPGCQLVTARGCDEITLSADLSVEQAKMAVKALRDGHSLIVPFEYDWNAILPFMKAACILKTTKGDIILNPKADIDVVRKIIEQMEPGKKLIIPSGFPIGRLPLFLRELKEGTCLSILATLTLTEIGQLVDYLPPNVQLKLHENNDLLVSKNISVNHAKMAAQALAPGRKLYLTPELTEDVVIQLMRSLTVGAIVDFSYIPGGQAQVNLVRLVARHLMPGCILNMPLVSTTLAGELLKTLPLACEYFLDLRQDIVLPTDIDPAKAIRITRFLPADRMLTLAFGIKSELATELASELPVGCTLDVRAGSVSVMQATAKALKPGRKMNIEAYAYSPTDIGMLLATVSLDCQISLMGMMQDKVIFPADISPGHIKRALKVLPTQRPLSLSFDGVPKSDIMTTIKLPAHARMMLPNFPSAQDAKRFVKSFPENSTFDVPAIDDEKYRPQRIHMIRLLPTGSILRLPLAIGKQSAKFYAASLPDGCKLDLGEWIGQADQGQVKKSAIQSLPMGCILRLPEITNVAVLKSLIKALPPELEVEFQYSTEAFLYKIVSILPAGITFHLIRSSRMAYHVELNGNDWRDMNPDVIVKLAPNFDVSLPDGMDIAKGLRLVRGLSVGQSLSINFMHDLDKIKAAINALPEGCVFHVRVTQQSYDGYVAAVSALKKHIVYLSAQDPALLGKLVQHIPPDTQIQSSLINVELPAGADLQASEKLAKSLFARSSLTIHSDAKPYDAIAIANQLRQDVRLDLSLIQTLDIVLETVKQFSGDLLWSVYWDEEFSKVLCGALRPGTRIILNAGMSHAIKCIISENLPHDCTMYFTDIKPTDKNVLLQNKSGHIEIDVNPHDVTHQGMLQGFLAVLSKQNRLVLPERIASHEHMKQFIRQLPKQVNIVLNGKKIARDILECAIKALPKQAVIYANELAPDQLAMLYQFFPVTSVNIQSSRAIIALPKGIEFKKAEQIILSAPRDTDIVQLASAEQKSNYELLRKLNNELRWSLWKSITPAVAYFFIKSMPEIQWMKSYAPHSDKFIERVVQQAYSEKLSSRGVRIFASPLKVDIAKPEPMEIADVKSTGLDLTHPLTEESLIKMAQAVRSDATGRVIPALKNRALLVARLAKGIRTGTFEAASARDEMYSDELLYADEMIQTRTKKGVTSYYLTVNNECRFLKNGHHEGLTSEIQLVDFRLNERFEESKDSARPLNELHTQYSAIDVEFQTAPFDELSIEDLAEFLLMYAQREEGWVFAVVSLHRLTLLNTETLLPLASEEVNLPHLCAAYASVINGKPAVYFVDPQLMLSDKMDPKCVITTDLRSFYKPNEFDDYVGLGILNSARITRLKAEKSPSVVVKSESHKRKADEAIESGTQKRAQVSSASSSVPRLFAQSAPLVASSSSSSSSSVQDLGNVRPG